ncbi:septum formation initiator family protein [Candidatus Nomurabacteria bacterium]|nr:septum formation initiator family protein [Candidatus Nomurabacteria bacterium]
MIGKITKYFGYNDLILVGALLIALGLAWNTVGVMQRNYYLQQKYNKLSAEVELQKIVNQNLKYNINYLKTDEYLEVAARSKFNKAAPGETLVYLPKKGETEQAATAKNNVAPAKKQASGWQANVSDWWQFLRGKNAIHKS